MVLFETVRDLRFADNIENALSSIDNELKKANLLKERELELKDKEYSPTFASRISMMQIIRPILPSHFIRKEYRSDSAIW